MLEASVDCLVNPDVDCFFATEAVGNEELDVELGGLFDSAEFTQFLSLLELPVADGTAGVTVEVTQSPASPTCHIEAIPAESQQCISEDSSGQGSHGSAGSVTVPHCTNVASAETSKCLANQHAHVATSSIKAEAPDQFFCTGPVTGSFSHLEAAVTKSSSSDQETHNSQHDKSDDSSQDCSRPNKRKLPEIDWRSIDDPEERRRQRRLAKNRVTAARSRERKKAQWSDMQGKLDEVEDENERLKSIIENFHIENAQLKEQLASLTRGASSGDVKGKEPAALINIATMQLSCPSHSILKLLAERPLVEFSLYSDSSFSISTPCLESTQSSGFWYGFGTSCVIAASSILHNCCKFWHSMNQFLSTNAARVPL